jgi:hypothetical protein
VAGHHKSRSTVLIPNNPLTLPQYDPTTLRPTLEGIVEGTPLLQLPIIKDAPSTVSCHLLGGHCSIFLLP